MHTIYRVSLHTLARFSWTCQGDLKYSASRIRRDQEEKWIQWMIQYPTQTKQTKYFKLSVLGNIITNIGNVCWISSLNDQL